MDVAITPDQVRKDHEQAVRLKLQRAVSLIDQHLTEGERVIVYNCTGTLARTIRREYEDAGWSVSFSRMSGHENTEEHVRSHTFEFREPDRDGDW